MPQNIFLREQLGFLMVCDLNMRKHADSHVLNIRWITMDCVVYFLRNYLDLKKLGSFGLMNSGSEGSEIREICPETKGETKKNRHWQNLEAEAFFVVWRVKMFPLSPQQWF